MDQEFDDIAWRTKCEAIASEAATRSSQSHQLYVEAFSSMIDGVIQEIAAAHRQAALKIAQEWDYATPDQRREGRQWNAEHGFCSHGIELGCCPAGCE